jgi:amino acid transporter
MVRAMPFSMLDIFAITVLVLLALSIVVAIVVLGSLPGRIARRRQHPYAQAVTVAGWIGLLFIVLWPLALIWAYVDVPRPAPAAAEWNDLRRRLSRAEAELHIQEAAE